MVGCVEEDPRFVRVRSKCHLQHGNAFRQSVELRTQSFLIDKQRREGNGTSERVRYAAAQFRRPKVWGRNWPHQGQSA